MRDRLRSMGEGYRNRRWRRYRGSERREAQANGVRLPFRKATYSMSKRRAGLLLVLLALLSGGPAAAAPRPAAAGKQPGQGEWLERTEAIMGTRVYVQLWATERAPGEAAIAAVMTE